MHDRTTAKLYNEKVRQTDQSTVALVKDVV